MQLTLRRAAIYIVYTYTYDSGGAYKFVLKRGQNSRILKCCCGEGGCSQLHSTRGRVSLARKCAFKLLRVQSRTGRERKELPARQLRVESTLCECALGAIKCVRSQKGRRAVNHAGRQVFVPYIRMRIQLASAPRSRN